MKIPSEEELKKLTIIELAELFQEYIQRCVSLQTDTYRLHTEVLTRLELSDCDA